MFKSMSTSLMVRGLLAVAVGVIAIAWPFGPMFLSRTAVVSRAACRSATASRLGSGGGRERGLGSARMVSRRPARVAGYALCLPLREVIRGRFGGTDRVCAQAGR